MVYGNEFVANHVPLEEGENTITATATDAAGNTLTTAIIVNADTTGDFTFTEEATLTYDGTDEVEFLENPNENEYTVRIITPGLYYFTAEVDNEGTIYTDTIAILVMDQGELDALLRAKWEAMKSALIAGDIEGALSYHYQGLRDKYEAIYTLLGSDLAIKVQQMQDIQFIYATGDRALYRIKRDHDIDGQTVTVTYHVYFSKDRIGLWQLERY
ncbi:MAG: hypothetical protein JRF21_08570 [Deltaproteobacteria bacterium]|nr:hypothetical protein [Deltaproteobacteria bacterium]